MLQPGADTLRRGRYQIEASLGTGGMAEVYRVYDVRLATHLAVKVLKEEFASRPKWRERFLQEARVTFHLRHPGIVHVHDVVDDEDPPYLIMELIDGASLLEVVSDHGPLSAQTAVDCMLQICAAISYAHARGVIHRDLNPRNCLLDRQGQVKVVDFGIATRQEDREHSTRVGTDAYMPPEQRLGRRVDLRADIYALGATLYALLTERPPPNLFEAHVAQEACRPLPGALAEIVVKATQYHPEGRFSSIEEMSAALHAARPVVAGVPPLPRPLEGEELPPTELYADPPGGIPSTLVPRESRRAEEQPPAPGLKGAAPTLPPPADAAPLPPPGARVSLFLAGAAALAALSAWTLWRTLDQTDPPPVDPPIEVVPVKPPTAPQPAEVPPPAPPPAEPPVASPPAPQEPSAKPEKPPEKERPSRQTTPEQPPTRPNPSPPQTSPAPPPTEPPPPVQRGTLHVKHTRSVSRVLLHGPGGRSVSIAAIEENVAVEPGTWEVRGVYAWGESAPKRVTVRAGEVVHVTCGEVSGCN